MVESYNDPNCYYNSRAYHTGKTCSVDGCSDPAGTAWSPHFCFRHNVERMDLEHTRRVANLRDWEIPQWGDPEPLDQSDFTEWYMYDGTYSSPIYLWLDRTDEREVICLSNTSDAYEIIKLSSAQDVDDLIRRLTRARQDVFGSEK